MAEHTETDIRAALEDTNQILRRLVRLHKDGLADGEQDLEKVLRNARHRTRENAELLGSPS